MSRKTEEPKFRVVRARVTNGEYWRLRRCAEAQKTTMSAILLRGLELVEAEQAAHPAEETA